MASSSTILSTPQTQNSPFAITADAPTQWVKFTTADGKGVFYLDQVTGVRRGVVGTDIDLGALPDYLSNSQIDIVNTSVLGKSNLYAWEESHISPLHQVRGRFETMGERQSSDARSLESGIESLGIDFHQDASYQSMLSAHLAESPGTPQSASEQSLASDSQDFLTRPGQACQKV